MAPGGPYIKLSVHYHEDPKVAALYANGLDGILARDLYVQMVTYCRRNQTDGFVPAEVIPTLQPNVAEQHARLLVNQLASTLLISCSATGVNVHAYVPWNGTKKEGETRAASKRAAAAASVRSRRNHAGRSTNGNTGRTTGKHVAQHAPNNPIQEEVEVSSTGTGDPSTTGPPAPAPAPARERETDSAAVVVHEIKSATGGLEIGRSRAQEIAAEIIGDRQLTSPGAYVRRAIRSHPDPFALADPTVQPDPAAPPRRKRAGVADAPAAQVHRAASTVGGRATTPATDEQRAAHAAAARQALADQAAARAAAAEQASHPAPAAAVFRPAAIEDVPLPEQDPDEF